MLPIGCGPTYLVQIARNAIRPSIHVFRSDGISVRCYPARCRSAFRQCRWSLMFSPLKLQLAPAFSCDLIPEPSFGRSFQGLARFYVPGAVIDTQPVFQLEPPALLTSVARIDHVLPTASGT